MTEGGDPGSCVAGDSVWGMAKRPCRETRPKTSGCPSSDDRMHNRRSNRNSGILFGNENKSG